MEIGFITDSTSDIPEAEAARLGVTVVPAMIIVKDQSLRDGVDISRADLYQRMSATGEIPTTSAPSAGAFESAYEAMFHHGFQRLISIHPASTLSSIVNSARIAAARFPGKVEVYESGQVSLGTGFQVIAAAEAASHGASFEQVRQLVQSTRERVHLVAMIESLTNLAHSGRVSTLMAGIGNLLQIKLLISLFEGTVSRVAQVRTHARGLFALAELALSWGPLERMAIVHANALHSADTLTAQLLARISQIGNNLPQPWTVEITPAIGVHVGSGTVGVIAVSKQPSG